MQVDFKQFINVIAKKLLARRNIAEQQMDSELVMFFKHNNEIYGAPEESRIAFARLKNPQKDDDADVSDDFVGIELKKILNGDKKERLFTKKDVKNIKIIEKDEAVKQLNSKK